MSAKRLSIGLAALAAALVSALAAALVPAPALARSTSAKAPSTSPSARALLQSHELWATIDVCDPADQPNTVGIRGSMPGDGHARDKMYMSFRLQYLNTATLQWVDLINGATPSFMAVGGGAATRQGGSSFQLLPVAGAPAITLRGVVDYEWQRGKTTVQTATRLTTAGHMGLAGADPANFSASSCLIG